MSGDEDRTRTCHYEDAGVELGRGTDEAFPSTSKGMTGQQGLAGTRVPLNQHCLGLCSAGTDQVLREAKEKEQVEPGPRAFRP